MTKEALPTWPARTGLPWLALGCAALSALGCGASSGADVPVDSIRVRVKAQDTAWSGTYLFADPSGKTQEVPTGRQVHLPLGAEVDLSLESRDFICLFAMPGLGLRDFAAPGLAGKFHFHAGRAGSYEFRGDEICGLPHTEKTRGQFIVEDRAAFQSWIREQKKKASR